MLWDNIQGHQEVIKTLIHQIEAGRIGHAYLFVGVHGIGKKLVARAFAANILCGKSDTTGKDKMSCHDRISRDIHPDLRVWQTEKKSFSVSDIRTWQKEVWLPASLADRKVIIIDEADKLTVQAQNALLKTLEEPPSDTIFILITKDTSKILNTIQSRCRLVRFNKLRYEQMIRVLDKHIQNESTKQFLYYISDGSPGQALKLEQKIDIKLLKEQLNKICSLLNSKNHMDMFSLVADIVKKDNEIELLLLMLEIIWGMALRQDERINDIIDNGADMIKKRPVWILGSDCQHIIKARKQIEQYQNKQLVLESLLLNILEDRND